jgi:hypothetical protein
VQGGEVSSKSHRHQVFELRAHEHLNLCVRLLVVVRRVGDDDHRRWSDHMHQVVPGFTATEASIVAGLDSSRTWTLRQQNIHSFDSD